MSLLTNTIDAVKRLDANITQQELEAVIQDTSCCKILELFSAYLDHLRHSSGPLAAFWMSYLDMVEILLALVRASREGNWLVHLAGVKSMLPWCFAYDKQNYARFLSFYYCQMSKLPETHHKIYQHMVNGGFSVQIGSSNPFGRIPIDQTIEETANKDTQTAGGTKGFSLNPGAISRYYITAEYRSSCMRNLREMASSDSTSKTGFNHTDLTKSRIAHDEKAVHGLVDLMSETWTNPFEQPLELISLSTGATAPEDVTRDLLQAREKGEKAYNLFQEERLTSTTKPFFDRLPRQNLKTFDAMIKKTSKKVSGKEQILRSDQKLFGQMVLVATSRKLNMQDVLKHPLGPLPWALANYDGTIKKTNKAALARKLEEKASPAEKITHPSATILDGMSLVNKIKGDNMTFEEAASQLLAMVLRHGNESDRIDVVFDVYKQLSIKNAERVQRATDKEPGIRFTNITAGHKIQQWRRILTCSVSKSRLVEFIVSQWKNSTERLNNKVMYATCNDLCYKITKDNAVEEDCLRCTHEEADTRVFLHCKHASEMFSTIISGAEDTDVIIISLACHSQIPAQLYVRCGTTSTRIRLIDITKVGSALGQRVCTALIGLPTASHSKSHKSWLEPGPEW